MVPINKHIARGIMPTLFSYRIPRDYGSAPNPFWGLCTLAICKPDIRRDAEIGDWVIGTGSAVSPIRNISNKVVYAMRVTQKMTMKDYDSFTRSQLPYKIPLMTSTDPRRRSGDSIYDYSIHHNETSDPLLRRSVHIEENKGKDLRGKNVLLSDHFFYFGDQPVALPEELLGIVPKGRAYQSKANAPYFDSFVFWIHNLGYQPGFVGKPQDEPRVWPSSQSHIVPLRSVVKRRWSRGVPPSTL